MSKTFSIIFMFLSLISCGKGGGGGRGGGGIAAGPDQGNADASHLQILDTVSTADERSETAVPNEAMTFEVNAKLIGFSRAQENKMLKAIDLIKRVVASEKFKKNVLSKTYKGRRRYVDNNGLTNTKIYQKILDAAEKIGSTSKNNTMDIEVKLYNDNNSIAVGYTYATVRRIWVNYKYFKNFTTADVAGNIFHEWLHKLGFGHAVKANPSRPHSVPYAIGYMIRDMAKELD